MALKDVAKGTESKYLKAVRSGKVTSKQQAANIQAGKSEAAGLKMIKKKPPKMTPVRKRITNWIFGKTAPKALKIRRQKIYEAGGGK